MEVKNHQWSLAALTIVGIIFRSEIAILLAAHTVVAYYTKRIPLKSIITSGLTGVLIGLGLTVSIDSFFWQRFPLWPELVGFVYNVVNGQAASWGTSPFHFYFTSALPRLLYNPLTYMICIPFALSEPLRRRSLYILIPNLIFVGIYSLQPHKEWRFIVYSIPPFTAVAAQGADWVWNRRGKSQVYRLLSLILAISTLGAFASSLLASVISSLNYPGADAINLLHSHVDGSQDVVRVHMDTLSCMTGITRFLQMPSSSDGIPHQLNRSSLWIYDKTDKESELLHPLFWDNFDYSLSERPGKTIGAWENIDIVKGYSGIGIVRPGEELSWPPPASAGKCHKMRGEGPWAVFGREMGPMFREVAAFARKYITRGWWIQVKMEPKIHILKRAPLL